MKKTKEEILVALSKLIGDNNSDEAITLYEDISDSIGDGDNEARIAEVENKWRKKYIERFMTLDKEEENEVEDEKTVEDEEKIRINDLFKEEK